MFNGTELGNKLIEKYELGKEQMKSRIAFIILTYQNPYPKDIFQWDNKEKLDFNRRRFNQHCYEIVENMRKDLLKSLEEING